MKRAISCLASLSLALTLVGAVTAAPAGLKKMLQPMLENKEPKEVTLRDKWALVIGCNRFADTAIPVSKFSSKNAVDIARTLRDPQIGRFPTDHVTVLNGPEANRASLQKALDEWLYKKALPNDLVVIYVSSRMMPAPDTKDPLICLTDSKASDPSTALNLYELLKTIKSRVGSEYIMCMVDSSPIKPEAAPKGKDGDWLAKTGVTVMLASDLYQPSYDNEQALRSRFANHFIEGMKAYGGNIPFYALAEGIWQNIKQEDEADPSTQVQTPHLSLPPNSQTATIPVGIQLKIPSQVAFGHPVDQIAMQRPDLVLPRAASAPVKPVTPKPAAPAPKPDDEDEEEIDHKLDFGPYMTQMKQDIQKKWQPPKGLESRKVDVVFSIKRDGTIFNSEVVGGSGVEAVDKSALDALVAASPLQPLPKGAPTSVDIKYTFDWKTTVKR